LSRLASSRSGAKGPRRQWPRRLALEIGQALVVAFVVVVVAFLLVRLVPGDPARGILGTRGRPAAIAALRHELHTDRSLPVQFKLYLGDLLRADLGHSIIQQGRSVSGIIQHALPITLAVVLVTIVISAVVGILLGLLAALTSNRSVDFAVRSFAIALLSMPPFFLGLILLLVVALSLHLLPAGGWGNGWPGNFRYVLLPSLALSGYLMPLVARTVRQAALDAQSQQFVEAAVARGIRPLLINARHILPNSLLPIITLLGLNVGALIAGAVVVEAVFGLPGLGTELVQSVGVRDYPVIQGIAVISALFVVAANLLTDAVYVFVDPRTRRA
jgi:peptide/nickel transport system permease protein